MIKQRLANKFPISTFLRRDPSSFGQRFLSSFSEIFEVGYIQALDIKDSFSILSRNLQIGTLFKTQLSEADYFIPIVDISGNITYDYPSILADTVTLTKKRFFRRSVGFPCR